jgi:hypothetical protein
MQNVQCQMKKDGTTMMQTRREWLLKMGGGFGGIALMQMLSRERALGGAFDPALEGGLHHAPKAKRVVQLFMNGGVSHIDTFDYKPALAKRHGEKIDFGIKAAATSEPGAIMKSPFEFKRHGACGRWVSSVFPHMAECVDELAFLMAMQSKTNVHGPASYMQNTGFLMPGFPCLGAWLSYGLGNLNDNLPTFVVLPDPRGLPYNATGNFSQGFLPAAHQGTVINPNAAIPIANLQPPEKVRKTARITPQGEMAGLQLLRELNASDLARHPGDSRLEARMASYELAARLQLSAPRVLDLSDETSATLDAYGVNDKQTFGFGRNCLIARRLLENDVRFVQVWSGMDGAGDNWDNHNNVQTQLPTIARSVDRPIATLLRDLRQRGMLEDTLVVWTTEFGRMPFTQGATGRDHNGGAFVTWLAGAGVAAGTSYGQSDEFGYQCAEDRTYCYDLHATILHLLGIDHKRLTFRHNGIDRRLTDVHGNVIREILA